MQDLVPYVVPHTQVRILSYEGALDTDANVECFVDHGMSIADILEGVDHDKTAVWMNGNFIDPEWYSIIPPHGSTLVVRAVPQKDVLRFGLQIAVVIAATYFTSGLALPLVKALVFGAVTLAGNLIANALVPPAKPKAATNDNNDFTRLASLTGVQNRVGRYEPIPRCFGTMGWYPPVGMTGLPYTEIVGNDQYIRALFILGYGPLSMNGVRVDSSGVKTMAEFPAIREAITIGGTNLINFEDVEVEVGNPLQMSLYVERVEEQRVDLDMNSVTQVAPGSVTESISAIRTTAVNTDEISLDLEFPAGLYSLSNEGKDLVAHVSITVEYKPIGTVTWHTLNFSEVVFWYGDPISGNPFVFTRTGQTRQTVRDGIRWKVAKGQYDVRVTRTVTNNSGQIVGSTDMRWLTLKSIFAAQPMKVPNVIAMAMRIKATDQISGTLDNVQVRTTSILPVWKGTNWVEEPTNNPAWCFVEAVCGVGCRRPKDRDTDIDLTAMIDWAAACDTNNMQFNFICEGQTTVLDLLGIIAAAGRASRAYRNNKISVVREEAELEPRQLFSARNATEFQLQKLFPKVPHALRCIFTDPLNNYQDGERLVYDDGFSEDTATLIETLQLPGVADADQAWKLGRFHLAQMRLRPETWTFKAYIDTLVAQRGDAIGIMDDAFLNGLQSGRIKTINRDISGNILSFTTDEELFMTPSDDAYKVAVRYVDSSGGPNVAIVDILTVTPSTLLVTPLTTLPPQVQPGDLFTFGKTPIFPAKITMIEPADDETCTITAVPLAPEILDADTGTIPSYSPLIDQPIDFLALPPQMPEVLYIRSDETVLYRDSDGSLRTQLVVTYKFPPGQPSTIIRMRYTETSSPQQWRRVEASSDTGKIATLDVVDGIEYTLQIQAENAKGLTSVWGPTYMHTVVGKSSPPSDVTGFFATIQSFGIQLQWVDIPDLDRDEYEIRIGTVWESAVFYWRGAGTQLRTDVKSAGTQTFLIKAIDTSGNYSVNATSSAATVAAPDITGLTSQFVGSLLLLQWQPVVTQFPIAEYEIRRGGSTFGTSAVVTRVKSTTFTFAVDYLGDVRWWVAPIDVAGNIGTAAFVDTQVVAPQIQSVNPQIIDNTVLLRWATIPGTLPIERYVVYRGETFPGAELIGRADTTFSTITESRGGLYTYWVAAIDTAGNQGPPNSVLANVDQPPDFVLNTDFHTDGYGARTNILRLSEDRRSIKFFAHTDNYLALPNTIIDGEQDFTLEFAAAFDSYPLDTSNFYTVISTYKGSSGTLADQFIVQFGTPGATVDRAIDILVYYYGSATPVKWTISGQDLYDGRFRVYSLTRKQSTNTVELFINGVSQGSYSGLSMSTLSVATNHLFMGISQDPVTGIRMPGNTAMDGRIDELRFWDNIQTSVQIAANWAQELQLNSANLKAYYRFNLEGNGITADDESPNDLNGNIFATQNLPVPQLVVPFPSSETVLDKFTIHGYTTPDDQIADGYPFVCQPVPLTASYEEEYNVGVVLPSSRLQVTLSQTDLVPGLSASVTISVKEHVGDAWTDFPTGEADVIATTFQYVKIHIDFTAASHDMFSVINQIDTKGFLKRKSDEGSVLVSANPTAVNFTVEFIDVASIVLTADGTTFVNPVLEFVDAPFPTSFNVRTFDAAGNPITGRTVTWIARGV